MNVVETTIEGQKSEVSVEGALIVSNSNPLSIQGSNSKVVKLSNGWLVAVVVVTNNSTSYSHSFYVSEKGDWSDSRLLGTLGAVSIPHTEAITSNDTKIYYVFSRGADSASVGLVAFDVVTHVGALPAPSGVGIDNFIVSNAGDLDITYDNGSLHLAHTARYKSQPGSYNLKYNRGNIAENGIHVTWGSSEQLTNDNNTVITNAYIHPHIIVVEGIPLIISSNQGVGFSGIRVFKRDDSLAINPSNTTWTRILLESINDSNLSQIRPTICYIPPEINGKPKGRLFSIWQSRRTSTHGNYDIYSIYSDDWGVTWEGGVAVVSSDANSSNQSPSLSYDSNGVVYVTYARRHNSTSLWNIYHNKLDGSTWSGNTPLVNNSPNRFTQCCQLQDPDIIRDKPIVLYVQDSQGSHVKFSGTWTGGSSNVTAFESTLDSPITVTKDELLPVISKSGDILKMLPQTFPNYRDINLKLYHSKINSLTVLDDNIGSNTIVTSGSTRPVELGDKLYYDGVLNTVLDIEEGGVSDINDITVVEGDVRSIGNLSDEISVRLSNGDIYVGLIRTNPVRWELQKSTDNGVSWTVEYTQIRTSIENISLDTNDTMIFAVETFNNSSTNVWAFSVDNPSEPIYNQVMSSTHTNTGRCSITVNDIGDKLAICISARTTTYPNSDNLLYGQFNITSDGLVPIGQYDFITKVNGANIYYISPSIHYVGDNVVITTLFRDVGGAYWITALSTNSELGSAPNIPNLSSGWYSKVIKSNGTRLTGGNYSKYISPKLSGTNKGTIWASWYSFDALSTDAHNVFTSTSKDGGLTWESETKISNSVTGGNHNRHNTIGVNRLGDITVFWTGVLTGGTTSIVLKRTCVGGVWGEVSKVSNDQSLMYSSPVGGSVIGEDNPLVLLGDSPTTKIVLNGKVDARSILTLEFPIVGHENQIILLSDFHLQNNGIEMNLKKINVDNYEFELNNINSNKTDLRIFGKDNKINSLA